MGVRVLIFNVTDISKIVYFDNYQDYLNRDKGQYSDFTFYIVKSNDSQILAYYGNRRLKDTLVVDSYPGLPDYPLNKLYIQVGERSDKSKYVKGLHYKYLGRHRDPEIVTLDSECLSEVKLFDNGITEISFRVEGVTEKILLTLQETDEISSDILDKVVQQVLSIKDSKLPSWKKWS